MEIWKDVSGFEGYYQISQYGNVKSLDRINNAGKRVRGIELKTYITTTGYKCIDFTKCGKKSKFKVHKLVAEAFIGPRPEGLVVDHIDNDRLNNNVNNLRYVSFRENCSFGKRSLLNKNKTSKFVGVSLIKKTGMFKAMKSFKGNNLNLGHFKTEEEARDVYLSINSLEDALSYKESKRLQKTIPEQ